MYCMVTEALNGVNPMCLRAFSTFLMTSCFSSNLFSRTLLAEWFGFTPLHKYSSQVTVCSIFLFLSEKISNEDNFNKAPQWGGQMKRLSVVVFLPLPHTKQIFVVRTAEVLTVVLLSQVETVLPDNFPALGIT
jgi:hypothetical protein